ncbi:hypothetical protein SDC9_117117 [bioreactor metagenome]|uniref:Uncharacterized protein n=1 Tax=bioreactor metagenome TaxID=1076179 RepID=A0A645C7X6_9ZZZZ
MKNIPLQENSVVGKSGSLNKDLKGSGTYAPPKVEIVEVLVEKGFALSDFGEGSDPYAG